MRQQFFKFVGILLVAWLLALPAITTAKDMASQDDLNGQKELFQIKLDTAKELLQKDIQAKDKELVVFKERVDKYDARISDIGLYLTIFGVLITLVLGILVFLGFVSVKGQVTAQAKQWFEENSNELKKQIADLEQNARDAKNKIDTAVSDVQTHEGEAHHDIEQAREALIKKIPINEEDKKIIEAQATQLKGKPESSYTFEDWNTRAFGALSENKLDLAAEYWDAASTAKNAKKNERANALFNKGVALGQLGRSEDAIALYDDLIERYSSDKEPAMREKIANAMFNKGVTLGQLGRSEDAISLYDVLIERYSSDKEPAIREKITNAINGKGFNLLCNAKRQWRDLPLRQSLLNLAADLFDTAIERQSTEVIFLGNAAYCAWLLGKSIVAQERFKQALLASGGGETIYNATLDDLTIAPVDLDEGFRALIDRLYAEYQDGKNKPS